MSLRIKLLEGNIQEPRLYPSKDVVIGLNLHATGNETMKRSHGDGVPATIPTVTLISSFDVFFKSLDVFVRVNRLMIVRRRHLALVKKKNKFANPTSEGTSENARTSPLMGGLYLLDAQISQASTAHQAAQGQDIFGGSLDAVV